MDRHNSQDAASKNGRRAANLPMTVLDWVGLVCLLLMAVCSLILLVQLLSTGMLTTVLVVALIAVLVVCNGVHAMIQIPRRRNKLPKLIGGVVALIISAVMIYAISAADAVQSALVNVSGKLVEKEITYVVVLKDSDAKEIGDAIGYNFGALSNADQKNTEALLDAVKDGLGKIKTTNYDSITLLANGLLNKEVDAIIINQGFYTLLAESEAYAGFSQNTRVLYEITTDKEVDPIVPNLAVTREPFVVYCSGIDARDTDINANSLSDVNILAVVNPTTHQVLLLNTPRDYYLPLISEPYTGMMDKLTHAGSIGIEESMNMLGNLYGVDVQYYARVNFLGLVDIVDALGGIDVHSDFTFAAPSIGADYGTEWLDDKMYYFNEGMNHINGYEALAFARQRQAFEDGDEQRGRNQMAVIKGIVSKAASSQILSSYADLLKAIEGCFITNMHYEDMSALVKMQLKDMRGWNITSYAVSGEGDTDYCATYDMDLWVMQPDMDTVDTAKALIQQVFNGETPVIPG
ncbi:MAG: LytR family transcriptional regulator [Ruminococcaceae bacterium]|nr:LytR family transcriptional regulator [Oscillospiraceae bacterium]